MYQDTPPLCSLLVCILNFDNKTSKIFWKCNHLFGRYLGETHFIHKSRVVTLLQNKEKQNVMDKCRSYIYIYIYQFICKILLKFRLFILKILSKNAFWTWIKGHNYVVSEWNYPTCNSIPLLSDTNVYAMHMQNSIEICLLILKILTKNAFWHKSRAITVVSELRCFWMKLSHLQSHTTPLRHQCLCKVWRKSIKKVLKLEHRNEAQSIFDIHQGP